MTSHAIKKIFYSLQDVVFVLSLSESSIQGLVRRGEFPAPKMMTDRRVGWLAREVEDWAENRPVSDLPPPPNTGAKKPRPSARDAQPAA